MGACQAKKRSDHDLMEVPRQDLLMDSSEAKIIKIHDTKMANSKNQKTFTGYMQRESYFVLPMIDRLKKDKLALKRAMNINR